MKRGGRLFYMKQLPEKEKAILFMREGTAPEKVVLDPNKWVKGTVALGTWMPSWDGKWVVFQYKANNSDEALLKVASADTSGWTKEQIDGGKYATPSWSADNAGFYYVRDVMVHPDWQRRGIGTALMRAVAEHLRTLGDEEALVGLFTGPHLHPFYAQFGFRGPKSGRYGMARELEKR